MSDDNGAVETDFDMSMESLESGPEAMDDPAGGQHSRPSEESNDTSGTGDTIAVPRKFRDAKEGRDPKTFYVSDHAGQKLTQLRHQLEDQFPNENVRKLDVYAAVIEVGLSNFNEPEQQLREWGYGKEIR